MKKAYFIPALLPALLFLFIAGAQSLVGGDNRFPPSSRPYWHPTDDAWQKSEWAKNEPQINDVKRYIDAAIQRGEVTKQTIADYEAAYLQAPNDPSALFQWAYAAYQGGRKTLNPGEQYSLNRKVDEALAQMPQPYPFAVTQLRFLIEVSTFPNPKSAPLGERLLAADPTNRSVKGATAFLLGLSHNGADKNKGLKYAKELQQFFPSEPAYHWLVGHCYDAFCWKTPNPAYAAKAIAEYKLYLQSLKPGDPEGRISELAIQRLQNEGKIPNASLSSSVATSKP